MAEVAEEIVTQIVSLCLENEEDYTIQECGSFLTDPIFNQARNSLNRPTQGSDWPKLMFLLAQGPHPEAENLSFINELDRILFCSDRFEVIVDARGFRPQDIACVATERTATLTAVTVQLVQQPGGELLERVRSMERKYDFPHSANLEMGTCNLSSDGILVVQIPWIEE